MYFWFRKSVLLHVIEEEFFVYNNILIMFEDYAIRDFKVNQKTYPLLATISCVDMII